MEINKQGIWKKKPINPSKLPKEMLAFIEKEAECFLTNRAKEPSFQSFRHFHKNGDRQLFESEYFDRRKRLTTFGLLSYLYPNESIYIEELENQIWQICQEFTWCLPAHLHMEREGQTYEDYRISQSLHYSIDLFAAETAFTLAEIHHIFQDRLDPFLIEKIKIEIDRRVIAIYLDNGPYEWEEATHNWAAVCAGSIGAAALYLVSDRSVLRSILARVFQTMECYLQGFEEDGACTEGYSYWQYGFGYFLYFLDLYEQATGETSRLLSRDKVHKIAQFQQNIFLSSNFVVNFSDAIPMAKPMLGFSHYLYHKWNDIHLPAREHGQFQIIDHCGRWAPAFRELSWYDSKLPGNNWPEKTVLFEESMIFLSRISIYAFAAKGGHNAEPHNHNDIGHFILLGGNEIFLKDLGAGQYHKDYFNDKRYDFICTSAAGHSIPIINGKFQRDGKEYKAIPLKSDFSKDEDIWQLALEQTYPEPTLLAYNRRFHWKKTAKPRLFLTDVFQFKKQPSSIIESFILEDRSYRLFDDYILFEGEEQSLKFIFDSQLTPIIEQQFFTNHQGEQEGFLRVQFPLVDLEQEIEVIFTLEFC